MIKRVAYLFLNFLVGLAGNLLAGWIQQDHWLNLFTVERMAATVIGTGTVMFVLAWIEREQTSFHKVYWHKYWYLAEIIHGQKTSHARTKYASLSYKLASNDSVIVSSAVQYIINQQQDVVETLFSLLIAKNVTPFRVLVLGESGAGKTTVLRQLKYKIANYAILRVGIRRPMPVLVELGNYSGEKLLDFIYDKLLAQSQHGDYLSKSLPFLLKNGQIILCFDALDEVFGVRGRIITQELVEFLNNPAYQHTPVIITSRTQEGKNATLSYLPIIEVQNLNDESVEDFIKLYNQSDLSISNIKAWLFSREMLEQAGIGRNPFWLKLILTAGAQVLDDQSTALIGDTGPFLDQSILSLLKHEWDLKPQAQRTWKRVLHRNEQLEETKNALAYLAHKMLTSGAVKSVSKEWALTELSVWLNSRVGLSALSTALR